MTKLLIKDEERMKDAPKDNLKKYKTEQRYLVGQREYFSYKLFVINQYTMNLSKRL
jgi:hypothetical protein